MGIYCVNMGFLRNNQNELLFCHDVFLQQVYFLKHN